MGSPAWYAHLYRTSQRPSPQRPDGTYYVPFVARTLFYVSVGYGVLALVFRMAEVGGSLNITAMREKYIDEAYLASELPLWLRLAAYFAIAPYLVSIILGLRDGTGRMRWKQLSASGFCASPAGWRPEVGVGSQGFLPIYFTSFLLARRRTAISRKTMRVAALVTTALLAVCLLFVVVGQVRNPEAYNNTSSGGVTWAFVPVAGYLGVPLLDRCLFQICHEWARHMGTLTFDFLALQGERLGLLEKGATFDYCEKSRCHVREHEASSLGSTHSTIIPRLVGDFGEERLIPGHGHPGRIVPVPRSVSVATGFSATPWR